MRKTLFLFAVALTFLAGCGVETQLRGSQDRGGLSDVEYNQLYEINFLHGDNIEARKAVFSGLFQPAASEKVQKLAKLIADNCTGSGIIPDNEMSGSINHQEIAGASCPIRWIRDRTFNRGTNAVFFNDNFETNSNDYLKESRVRWRRISGNYSIKKDPNTGVQTVSGVLTVNGFEIQGFGKLTGGISVHGNYPPGNRGTGSVILNLSNGRWQHSAAISWDLVKFDPVYFINGKKVERKVFEELFSGFELTKIMENSINMR